MKCRRVRQLLAVQDPPSRPLRDHLADCPDCAAYSRRLSAVHGALGAHHVTVTPPSGFAARVRARLRRDDDPLGWAALRLLPATLGLVVLLSWLNLRTVEPAADEFTDPTTAVLSWVLEPVAEGTGGDEPEVGEDG